MQIRELAVCSMLCLINKGKIDEKPESPFLIFPSEFSSDTKRATEGEMAKKGFLNKNETIAYSDVLDPCTIKKCCLSPRKSMFLRDKPVPPNRPGSISSTRSLFIDQMTFSCPRLLYFQFFPSLDSSVEMMTPNCCPSVFMFVELDV